MIRSAIGSGIGAGALFFAVLPALAASPGTGAADRAIVDRSSIGPRLYASLLPRMIPTGLAGGQDTLLHVGGGMIVLAPFGEGFSLSARDRPDRGGVRGWASLRGLESLGGRNIVRKFAPALMLGYGKRPDRGASFAVEAGMMFRNRLASPLAGLSRNSPMDVAGSERSRGTALMQARFGYRF